MSEEVNQSVPPPPPPEADDEISPLMPVATNTGENSNLQPDPSRANIAELPRTDPNVQVALAEIATLEQMDPPAYFVDGTQLDPAAWARLNAIKKVSMVQGNALGEALTGGIMPSKYYISDWNHKYQPYRNGKPFGDLRPYPLFAVEEEMSDFCCTKNAFCGCFTKDCMCRMCCSPRNPTLLRFYTAGPPIDPGPFQLCGQTMYEQDDVSHKVGAPFMTLERYGCCGRWPGVFVCCEQCQDEMRLHRGTPGSSNSADTMAGTLPYDTVLARSVVPIAGGGCTPTIEVFQRQAENGLLNELIPPGAAASDGEQMLAVVEGPSCFGGCKDLCTDTEFTLSSEAGGSADIGKFLKRKPASAGCSDMCRACCSTADNYDLELTDRGALLTPEQKAVLIGEMVHLDLMFFESDQNLPVQVNCSCDRDCEGCTVCVTCLACLMYCYGCLIPCQCCCCIHFRNNKD